MKILGKCQIVKFKKHSTNNNIGSEPILLNGRIRKNVLPELWNKLTAGHHKKVEIQEELELVEQYQRDKAEYAVLLVPEQVNVFIHQCSMTVHNTDAIKS